MDTRENIETRVKRITAEHFGIQPDQVCMDKNFAKDFDSDSLDAVEMVMHVEDEFALEIADEEAEKLLTPADAVALVQWKQASKFKMWPGRA